MDAEVSRKNLTTDVPSSVSGFGDQARTSTPAVQLEQSREVSGKPIAAGEQTIERAARTAGSMPAEVIQEKPIVEQIQEKVFIEKRTVNNIQEIHEQPIYEIHEKPIIKNIQEAPEIKRFTSPLIREEVNKPEVFTMPPRSNVVERKQETFVAQVAAPPVMKEVLRREVLKIIEQPIIREVHHRPVIEIYEQPVLRLVYEKPIVRTVRDAEKVEGTAMTTIPQEHIITEQVRPKLITETTTSIQQTTTGPASEKMKGPMPQEGIVGSSSSFAPDTTTPGMSSTTPMFALSIPNPPPPPPVLKN